MVREGYQQTEVGVLPEDWQVSSLENVCDRISVGLATSVTKYYREDGVPIVRNLNIKDGYFDGQDMLFISKDFARANLTKAAKALDVLTVRTGANLGQTCVLPANFHDCQTFTTLITTPKKSILDAHFLCLHMTSFAGKKEMKKLEVGGGKGNLNTGDLRKYRVWLPPLPEQRSISQALSDVDALIASLDKAIAKKRAIKTATMQQLLTGKKRLPGFGKGKGYQQTEVGVIPEDWNTRILSEMCTKIQDGTHFSPKLGGNDFYYITSKNIGRGFLNLSNAEKIDKVQHEAIYKRCDVRKGDLLLTKDGVNTGNVALNELDEEFSLLSSVALLRFEPTNYEPAYFLHLILSSESQKRIKDLMSGNAITRLTLEKIRKIPFPFPLLEEQQAISTVLSDMDAEIAALENRLAKTQSIKQGMMQELLTGRTRLV